MARVVPGRGDFCRSYGWSQWGGPERIGVPDTVPPERGMKVSADGAGFDISLCFRYTDSV